MKLCCVCGKENSSYKCPTCRQPYCSAACCKFHGQSRCEPSAQPVLGRASVGPERQPNFPTEDTVPLDKLRLLGECDEVKKCLKNPHVRDIVKGILEDQDPTRAIALAMTEPIFVELADACLRIVEPEERPAASSP